MLELATLRYAYTTRNEDITSIITVNCCARYFFTQNCQFLLHESLEIKQLDKNKNVFSEIAYLIVKFEETMHKHTSQNSFNKWTKISSLEITIFDLKMKVKSGLEFFILKFTKPLQSCCCPVQKNLLRKAELARQVSRYLLRGSMEHFSSSFLS